MHQNANKIESFSTHKHSYVTAYMVRIDGREIPCDSFQMQLLSASQREGGVTLIDQDSQSTEEDARTQHALASMTDLNTS